MEKEEEEQWNVTMKVLVGNGKFREYRLPKSLSTDRSPLWRAKHEVGKRIADIMKNKKSQIAELKRCIKNIEQSQSSWRTLAKCVNRKNENFFLDALVASAENIEKFENENFFSDHSWTKLRDITELTEEEMQELCFLDSDDESSENNECQLNGVEKSGHYDWICTKTVGLSTSSETGVVEKDRVVTETVIETPAKSENAFVRTKRGEDLDGKIQPSSSSLGVSNSNGDSCIDQEHFATKVGDENNLKDESLDGMRTTPKTDTEIVTFASGNINNNKKPLEKKKHDEVTTETKVETNGSSIQKSEISLCNGKKQDEDKDGEEKPSKASAADKLTLLTENDTHHIKISDTSIPMKGTTDLNGKSQTQENGNDLTRKEISKSEQPTNVVVNKNECGEDSIDTSLPSSPQSSSHPKKQRADLSGFSRLRLTSASSSTEAQPVTSIVPKKTGNIWELRAAEREEKLYAERYMKQHPKTASTSASSAPSARSQPAMSINTVKTKSETYQNGNASKPLVNKKAQKVLTPKKPTKPTDSNGWITFAAKKGGNRPSNGTFLKDLENKQVSSPANKTLEVNGNDLETKSLHSKPQSSISTSPSVCSLAETAESEKLVTDSEPFEPSGDQSKAEKRAKRRQRVQEKAKLSAKLNKEEEKKAREQKRIEHELKIASEKKDRESKQKQEYEQRRQEIEKIRREREAQQRARRNESEPEGPRIQEMLKSRDRLAEHIREKTLEYRMIGSKLYIDKRVPELSDEHDLEINKCKYRTLVKYQARIVGVEEMNRFLVFMSFRLIESGNVFKLENMLDYLYCMSQNSFGDPKTQIETAIQKTFESYWQKSKIKLAECFHKATTFADSILDRLSKMSDRSGTVERTEQILNHYKMLFNEVVDYMGITSYLRTRMNTEFFIVEEDYLLTVTESENCGYQGENKKENESDDEDEFDKPEVQDMSCQTEGEPYDVRAASLLPRKD